MHSRLLARAACALITVVTLASIELPAALAAGTTGAKHAIAPAVAVGSQPCTSSASAERGKLCGLQLRLSRVSHYDSFVTCRGCSGSWVRWTKSGNNWDAKGSVPLASGASVLLVVTEPGAVGRYRLYRAGGSTGLKLASQGCVAADIPASEIRTSSHGEASKLPTVPCVAPKIKATIFDAGLNELSHTTTHAIVYGNVSKPMWLTIAQTTATTCKDDPLAYTAAQRHSRIWLVFKVKGAYDEGFQTNALLPSGRYCMYLQQGSEYDKFPDGWVSQWTYNDYHTGDVLTGPASTSLSAAGSTTVTLTGDAPRTETLESYDQLTPCTEFAELAQLTGFGGSTMQVSGNFTETLTTGNFTQSGYVCSYLYDGGFTVALSTDQVTVAGTSLKDQTDYTETAYSAATPVSDPIGDAGTAGPGITAGETVHVRCVINGQGLAAFDTVWYELDSAPYGDAYYVPSEGFYNNGQTSGTPGKIWDPAVPFCDAA